MAIASPVRSMADPGVAFVAASAPPEVEEILGDAGWLCVPFEAGDDPAQTWRRAMRRQRAAVVSGGD